MGAKLSKDNESSVGGDSLSSAARIWNVAALATVLVPLLILMFARIFNGEEGGGGGEEEGFWSWSWFRNNEGGGGGEERNGGALVFVYLWSLLSFLVLVWFGNKVLGGEAGGDREKAAPTLFVALLGFTNLAFLCFILMQSQVRN